MKSHVLLAAALAGAACSSNSQSSAPPDASTPVDSSTLQNESSAPQNESGSPSDASLDSSGTSDEGSVPPWDAASWNEDAGPGDAGDTWASWVQGFFEKYCVVCHSASGEAHEIPFLTLASVLPYKDTIRCGIATAAEIEPSYDCPDGGFPPPEQFPLSSSPVQPPPTAAERARIIGWISDGCP